MTKALIGFSNTMTPHTQKPPIIARFRDHLEDGQSIERIGESSFFTPDEFLSADHHFSGEFDAYGQFNGTITIYNKEPVNYVSSWQNLANEMTKCGPFKVDIAYIQGTARESRIPAEEHARLAAKLNRIGGLYIYRDGIRILPYGDSDYDFLDIERRRTKSAGYYFFSYRRMFGLVETSRKNNPSLVEKAGREGFRQNKAYRQFRDILENFFVQLAADFFREGGAHSSIWDQTKAQLDKDERLRRKREEETKQRRAEFAKDLNNLFTEIEAKKPEIEVEKLLENLEERLRPLSKLKDKSEAVAQTLRFEAEVKNELSRIKEHYRLAKPRGWALNKNLQRDWAAFQTEAARLETEVFTTAEKRIAKMSRATTDEIGVEVESRVIVRSSLKNLQKEGSSRLRALESSIKSAADSVRDRVLQRTQQSISRAATGHSRSAGRF